MTEFAYPNQSSILRLRERPASPLVERVESSHTWIDTLKYEGASAQLIARFIYRRQRLLIAAHRADADTSKLLGELDALVRLLAKTGVL